MPACQISTSSYLYIQVGSNLEKEVQESGERGIRRLRGMLLGKSSVGGHDGMGMDSEQRESRLPRFLPATSNVFAVSTPRTDILLPFEAVSPKAKLS